MRFGATRRKDEPSCSTCAVLQSGPVTNKLKPAIKKALQTGWLVSVASDRLSTPTERGRAPTLADLTIRKYGSEL